jgi:AcrR family transcriptional regulator
MSDEEAADRTSRAGMLTAGAEILDEADVRTLLRPLTARAVSRRAGRSTGAFYNVWETQEAFVVDLIRTIVAPGLLGEYDVANDAIAVTGGFDRPTDGLRAVALRSLTTELGTPGTRAFLTLVARSNDPIVAAVMPAVYAGEEGAFAQFYETYFGAAGLRTRPPMTWAEFASILAALQEGCVIRHLAAPDTFNVELFADAVIAIVVSLLVPVDGDETMQTLHDSLDASLTTRSEPDVR